MRVRWGSQLSQSFGVSNGVRQGKILSPYLFAVYIDQLSKDLNRVPAGCYIGNTLVNHVGSVVDWLKHRTDDQHGLGSKPTCAILLCPWERRLRHFLLLGDLGKQF